MIADIDNLNQNNIIGEMRMTHCERIVFRIYVEMIEMYSTDQALCL